MINIANVVGWKFNNQEGMVCKNIDGVITIIEFPGGIPSQADQDAWTAEYTANILVESRKSEIYSRLDEIDMQSVRALRSKGVGRGSPQDDLSLSELDDEAESLRLELAGL